ncbi:MAG: hypothetical protein ACHQQS_06825 [Thermoanaerobaculales bacterium]
MAGDNNRTMWVVSAACVLAAMGAGAGTNEVAPGTPIVDVRIERHDIYDLDDPATSAWPYRWVDALHIQTREEFIRSLLLFHVGDPLDPARLAESELILRGTGFLNPVHISARPAPGGAEVVVETHDQWTTGVGIDLGISGNRRHAGGSISEDNLLGLGKSVLLDVRSDPERTTTTFRYSDLTFLRSRWQLGLEHDKSSDGSTDIFQLQYPFFAILTPRAGGAAWQRQGLQEYLWSGGQRNVAGQANTRTFEVWGGLRLPGDGILTNRLTAGVFGDQAVFRDWQRLDGSPYPQPQDRNLLGVEVGWQHQILNLRVVQGFRAWLRQEDLLLGPNWQVTTGLSLPAFGGDRTRLRYQGSLTVGQMNGSRYSWLITSLSGRLEQGGIANGLAHLEVGGALTGTAGWRARAAADLGTNLDGDQQLTLGADTGLRGYDPNTFDGTSRVVTNLEWRRRITGELLHVAALGLTAFADGGKTWGARVGPPTDGWRGDVGAGLLVEITRASVVRILRLEFAYPDRGKGPVFQLTSDSLF